MLKRKPKLRIKPIVLCMSLLALTSTLSVAQAYAAQYSSAQNYNIEAGNLSQSLNQLAKQARVSLLFDAKVTDAIQVAALYGDYSVDQALSELLANSPLVAQKSTAGYIIERQAANNTPPANTSPAATTPNYTEENPEAPTQLPELQVKAQSSKDWAFEQTRAVSVISRDNIDQRFVQHVSDILQETPGSIAQSIGITLRCR